jgi:hypothetical protein
MKTTASYLLLINLFFLTSCQEQYSEVEIQQQVLWNATIQRTAISLRLDKAGRQGLRLSSSRLFKPCHIFA